MEMSDNIEFTREDSDRLVRLEAQNVAQTSLLTSVLAQTTKTNGRVNDHDSRINKLELDAAVQVNNKTSRATLVSYIVSGLTLIALFLGVFYHKG